MFIRKKPNKSGSTSVQIILKERGRYRVLESVGVGHSEQEISALLLKARFLLKQHQRQPESVTELVEVCLLMKKNQSMNLFCPA
jgi:hypothetical protein